MKAAQSLKDTVYNAVIEDILSSEYKPNEILNEKALVEKYGFSKTPVREALLSLCNDNVLRNIPRYGYEVVRITTDDVHDMLQFRYLLESGLLSIHYDSFSERQIERLAEIDKRCTDCGNDVWAHWAGNSEFHTMMITFCGNHYAVSELQQCMNRLKIAYAQFYWNDLETAVLAMDTRNHSSILRCLREKNQEELLRYLKEDLSDFGGAKYAAGLKL